MNRFIAVVSTYKWATKTHAAQIEMASRPGTYRSLCGKPWQVASGEKFEDVNFEGRCERCEVATRRTAA